MAGSSQGSSFPRSQSHVERIILVPGSCRVPSSGLHRTRAPQLPQLPGNSQQEKPAAAACRSVCFDCLLFIFFFTPPPVAARCLFVRVIHSPGLGGSWSVPRVTMVPGLPWGT